MQSTFGDGARLIRDQLERNRFDAGYAAGMMMKAAGAPTSVYALSGELQLSAGGWGLLSIPNAIVRGLFAALDVPGAELPLRDGKLNAHISVLRPEDLAAIGGPDRVSEWGKRFAFNIGPVQEVAPAGWKGVSRVWLARVDSPALKTLRRTYGLSALPNENKHEFHITIARRAVGALGSNNVSKAAGVADVHAPARPDAAADHGRWQEIHGLLPAGLLPGARPPLRGLRGRDPGDLDPAQQAVKGAGQHLLGQAAGGECSPASWLKEAAHPALPKLLEAKALSDRKDYKGKHEILKRLLASDPGDFREDSRVGGLSGITHVSGFRIHVPRKLLPESVRQYGKVSGSYTDPDHPGGITPGPADPYENSSRTDERGDPCPAGECCPHCRARLERGDDGNCNRCGEVWPNSHSKLAGRSPAWRVLINS